MKNPAVKPVGAVPKNGFSQKRLLRFFFLNTRFGMWKVSPKTAHTQFLCCFPLYKLPLKTNRALWHRESCYLYEVEILILFYILYSISIGLFLVSFLTAVNIGRNHENFLQNGRFCSSHNKFCIFLLTKSNQISDVKVNNCSLGFFF